MRRTSNLNKTSFVTVLNTFQNIMSETIDFLSQNVTDSESMKINGESVKSIIKNQSSHHKYVKSVYNENVIINSIDVILGERDDIKSVNNVEVSVKVTDKARYFPLIETLKLILSNDCLRNLILTERISGNSWNYQLYTDSEEFKSHPLFSLYPNAIRILLYSDDIELVNPLGSKTGSNKLTLFYFKVQNFPPHFNTKLDNIFLLCIAYSYDVKLYGYKKVLSSFIADLNLLEEGIMIKINKEDFFLIGTILNYTGDAQAAAEIMEMVGPSGVRFCKSCLITREDLINGQLFDFQPRSKEIHDNQLQLLRQNCNVPKDFGIKSVNSVLNESKYFHTANNPVFDIMHNLLEGVLQMEIKLVLQYYILEKKYLSLDYFNKSINLFKYGQSEKKNKPSPNFSVSMLQSKSHNIKQSAIQTWLLLRVLPFLIIENIPMNDTDHMMLLHLLLKIIEISFAFNISNQMICDLNELIKYHHRLFKHLFPNRNFINKHHHITHYPDNIIQNGPLVLYSCLNFEAKHQEIKKFVTRGCNFINLPKSISNYFEIEQCMTIFHQNYQDPHVELISFKEFDLQNSSFQENILKNHPHVKRVNRIYVMKINSMRYMKNMIVTLKNEHALYPYFFLLKDMIEAENKIYFHMQVLKILEYNSDLNAYQIDEASDMILIDIKNLENFKPNSIWMDRSGVKKYVSLKEYNF